MPHQPLSFDPTLNFKLQVQLHDYLHPHPHTISQTPTSITTTSPLINTPQPPTMADKQPPTIHEGATADAEDPQPIAKSAEDRKAASALASLDADDSTSTAQVDHEAASAAMKALGGAKPKSVAKPAAKNVKVDPADVTLLVHELEVSKARATELLKSCEGDAVRVMKEFVNAH